MDPLPLRIFTDAATIYRQGRRKGYTIRSSVDCLIAAIAIDNKVAAWRKDGDIDTIGAWVAAGAPEGDPNDRPPKPEFVDGWNIGQVEAAEIRPQHRNVPYHIHVFVLEPGQKNNDGPLLTGLAPPCWLRPEACSCSRPESHGQSGAARVAHGGCWEPTPGTNRAGCKSLMAAGW
jgi:hypothetical protein